MTVLESKSDFVAPAPFVVFCHQPVEQGPDKGKFYTHRVGGYPTLAAARKAINDDLDAMQNTFGGLLPSLSTHGRSYRIFQASYQEIV